MARGILCTTERRRRLKSKAVDYSGGHCLRCRYCECEAALTFHHVDPAEKDIGISRGRNWRWDSVKAEIDKTVMLCNRCHAELHAGAWALEQQSIDEQKMMRDSYVDRPLGLYATTIVATRQQKAIKRCNCGVELTTKRQQCHICAAKIRRQRIPAKDVLADLVWKVPTTAIAKYFNVSDKAVSKWCTGYGIQKPGMGYWRRNKPSEIVDV